MRAVPPSGRPNVTLLRRTDLNVERVRWRSGSLEAAAAVRAGWLKIAFYGILAPGLQIGSAAC